MRILFVFIVRLWSAFTIIYKKKGPIFYCIEFDHILNMKKYVTQAQFRVVDQ